MAKKRTDKELVRARATRLSIRAQDLVDRLQDYALGDETEAPMGKGQLDAAKFLLNMSTPAYKEPAPAHQDGRGGSAMLGGPTRQFVLCWAGGEDAALLLAQRAAEKALPPPVEALPAPAPTTYTVEPPERP